VKLQHSIALSLAGMCALAAASAAFGSSARTINAIAKGTGITFVDADHSGKASAGDYEIGTVVYVNPKSAKPIGHGSIVCTQIGASATAYQCQGVAHFAGGDIVTAGPFSASSKTGSLAVVGGTGVYARVAGLQSTTWLDNRFARAKVTFTLAS
jgi:hypothetical protein